MNRHVKLTIATPEGVVLGTLFVSVPASKLSAADEIIDVIRESFDNCAETLQILLKLDAIDDKARRLQKQEK
jgi:hypothetical protein